MQEVSYYSSKMIKEENFKGPSVIVPKIGIKENLNFESINNGVMVDELSYKPSLGKIILHGHRTLLGSPFLRLNELKKGDEVIIKWPGIGTVNYKVDKTYIVPPTHTIEMNNNSTTMYMITCDPIGSDANRLIVESHFVNVEPLNQEVDHPNKFYGLLITIGVFLVGLIFSYFYPIKEDRKFVFATIVIISAILLILYIFPVSPDYFGFLGSLSI
jgi:LPXTG-site transpeptidase (sortase) family protein